MSMPISLRKSFSSSFWTLGQPIIDSAYIWNPYHFKPIVTYFKSNSNKNPPSDLGIKNDIGVNRIPPIINTTEIDILKDYLYDNLERLENDNLGRLENENLSIRKTGILSTKARHCLNAVKYTNSNIMIIDKLLCNKQNDRIKLMFGPTNNINWEYDANLIKRRLDCINKACDNLYNIFMIIE